MIGLKSFNYKAVVAKRYEELISRFSAILVLISVIDYISTCKFRVTKSVTPGPPESLYGTLQLARTLLQRETF